MFRLWHGFLHLISLSHPLGIPVMDAAVARTAVRQHAVFLREQVLALGMTDEMIDHRIASGRWVRVSSGVYPLAGVP